MLPIILVIVASGTATSAATGDSGLFHPSTPETSGPEATETEAGYTSGMETSNDTLFVREFVLAMDVVEREPVDIVSSYNMSDARAWCFARIHNSEGMQDVYFKWYYEDEIYFEMNSKIGSSPNWRTYSSVGLQPGSWRVVLEDRTGDVLDEIRFHVSE